MSATGTISTIVSGTSGTPLVEQLQAESVIAKAARKAWLTGAIVTGTLGTVTLTPHVFGSELIAAIHWQGSVEYSDQGQVRPIELEAAMPSAGPADTGVIVRELRAQSGLTWDQMARLFGVSRRAVHHWAAGGRMNSRNIEFLGTVERVVSGLRGTTPEERRTLLFSQDGSGRSVYDALRGLHAPRDDGSTESGYTFDQLIGALHDRT